MYTPFSFVMKMSKPYKKWYICLCLAPLFSGIYFAANNYIVKILIDTISSENLNYQAFLHPLAIFLAMELGLRFFWSLHDFSEYKFYGNVFRDLVVFPYEYVQNHSYSYFQNNFAGSIVSKLKGLTDGFCGFWDKISHSILENVSSIVINLMLVAFVAPKMLLPIFLYVAIMGVIAYFQQKKYKKIAFENKQNWHVMLGMVSDRITNMFTIFQFATKNREINAIKKRYDDVSIPAINELHYYNYKAWLATGLVNTLILLGVFWYAASLRIANEIETGALVVGILATTRCGGEIFSLVQNWMSFVQNLAELRASLDGIFSKQEILDKKDAKVLVI